MPAAARDARLCEQEEHVPQMVAEDEERADGRISMGRPRRRSVRMFETTPCVAPLDPDFQPGKWLFVARWHVGILGCAEGGDGEAHGEAAAETARRAPRSC